MFESVWSTPKASRKRTKQKHLMKVEHLCQVWSLFYYKGQTVLSANAVVW